LKIVFKASYSADMKKKIYSMFQAYTSTEYVMHCTDMSKADVEKNLIQYTKKVTQTISSMPTTTSTVSKPTTISTATTAVTNPVIDKKNEELAKKYNQASQRIIISEEKPECGS